MAGSFYSSQSSPEFSLAPTNLFAERKDSSAQLSIPNRLLVRLCTYSNGLPHKIGKKITFFSFFDRFGFVSRCWKNGFLLEFEVLIKKGQKSYEQVMLIFFMTKSMIVFLFRCSTLSFLWICGIFTKKIVQSMLFNLSCKQWIFEMLEKFYLHGDDNIMLHKVHLSF